MTEPDPRDGMVDDIGERGGGAVRRSLRLRVAAWTAAATLLLAGAAAGAVHFKLDGNIAGIDIDSALGPDRPADAPNGSLDILVLGSDSRSGENGRYGRSDGTARSDTAMIVHLNDARDRMSVVSVPRDTLVTRPPCRRADGGTAPAGRGVMFNEAYEVGGPACTIRTVESMTGIRMDHYVEIDFSGFRELVDALGGVRITTTEPIHDEDSHLSLRAGTHTLDGEQALALVRTRKGIGNGSDLGRVQLQQEFLKALVEQVRSIGVFSDPRRLYELADTATSALTTDSRLDSVADLAGLARSMGGVDSGDVETVVLPVRYAPGDPNRVVPIEDQAERVWAALRADEPVPASVTRGSAVGEAGAGRVVE